MQNLLSRSLRLTTRCLFKAMVGWNPPVRAQRVWLECLKHLNKTAAGTSRISGAYGVEGLFVYPLRGPADRALLYFHGGGYMLGSPATHASLASHLAVAADCGVLIPKYRLAPEHPYPAALEDAVEAYRKLLDHFRPECIAIGGDSAGGGLALCAVQALRDAGLPQPSALVLISPWTDLTLSGDTIDRLDSVDPMLGRAWLTRAAEFYRGQLAAADPRLSPLNARFDGLPPMLIQVGSDEVLLSDSQRLHERAGAAGVDSRVEVEAGYWHDFQVHAGLLKASDAAILRIAEFLQQNWAVAAPAPTPGRVLA